ncbi:MAG: hypothetical protein ERJ67_00955 [Aphanocapsa feldmannii 277cV]|uniref:Uncharacterized protein n=1 Tax=Aphanocapsa feldmannii 277cV TaxID=2507553 RepID=A0A524RQY0_9CHRO|nr:MAG: hypothetical protein ERJ69_06835 [Aphanocapsa feldmannii 288cV]TGG96306.1 MAG: hypothetical protein ERJ67_00955 [Aphanocapsa feldmannii 277cV]
MFVVEISLKLSAMTLSVQRKELASAIALYEQIKQSMAGSISQLLELSCEKNNEKKVALLSGDIVALQIYEKSTLGGGAKRPGFSLEA